MRFLCFIEAGGDDEFQGFAQYTFVRPDGTELGKQAESAWLQICEQHRLTILPPSLTSL
jgi:hypothetical protein